MSSSNQPPRRTARISVKQVWKRKTPSPKSPQNLSPHEQFISSSSPHHSPPPSQVPSCENILEQLHNIAHIIDTQLNRHEAPPNPPRPLIHPPTPAQVDLHSSFCHCCRFTRNNFHSLRGEINFIKFLITLLIPHNANSSPKPFSLFQN